MTGKNLSPEALTLALKGNRVLPVKQPYIFDFDFPAFLSKNGLASNASGAIIYCFFIILVKVFDFKFVAGTEKEPGATVKVKGNEKKDFVKFTPGWNGDTSGSLDPKYDDPEITAEYYTWVQIELSKATQQLIELVSAQQVGSLNEKNVTSYFKMAGMEIPVPSIMKVVEFASKGVQKFINEKAVQDQVKVVPWMKYHTAAASTQDLVHKFYQETKNLLTWEEGTIGVIQAAVNNPWDRAFIDNIPQRVVGLCWCYLKATDSYPQNTWYQGDKAANNLSTFDRVRYTAAFKKYANLMAKTDVVDATVDIASLKTALETKL